MNTAYIIYSIFNWTFMLLGIIGVVGLWPFIITSIIFWIKYFKEQDIEKKKEYKKKGIIFIALPFILIIGAIILIVILKVIGGIFEIGLQ